VAGDISHLEALLQQHRDEGGKFPQTTLEDALNFPEMDNSTWNYIIPSSPEKGLTITRKGERKLIERFGGVVWLTEMDHIGVPFYQAYVDGTNTKGRCADLLLGNGEVLGLGERHVFSKEVQTALRQHQVSEEPYTWYKEIRDTKPALTTGWGMGVERFLAWVFQHDDIRDLTIIPRMKGSSFAP
jgi:aspartyl/asparaginyl-tRNA synthetase